MTYHGLFLLHQGMYLEIQFLMLLLLMIMAFRFGILSLLPGVREGEYCVLFRNNHFSVLHKYKGICYTFLFSPFSDLTHTPTTGELYLLITDLGYQNEPVVWEKLDQVGLPTPSSSVIILSLYIASDDFMNNEQIEGDTPLLTFDFKVYRKKQQARVFSSLSLSRC